MRTRLTHLTQVLLLIVLGSWQAYAQTESSPTSPPAAVPTTAEIESAIAQVENNPDLNQAEKDAVLSLYRKALDSLKIRNEAAARLIESQDSTAKAPDLLKSIRQELSAPPAEPKLNLPDNPSLQDLEQGLKNAESTLQGAKELSDALALESTRRSQRRPEIAAQLGELRQQLKDVEVELKALSPDDQSVKGLADRAVLLAKRAALETQIQALDAESASYDARTELLAARKDLSLRRVREAQAAVDLWQKLVVAKRAKQAAEAAAEAQKRRLDAARKHPVLSRFATENTQLADLRIGEQGTTGRLARATERLDKTRAQLEAMRAGYQAVQKRIRATQLNRATGLILRNQYKTLPDPTDLSRGHWMTLKEIEKTELQRIELQEQRDGAGDINAVVSNLMNQIGSVPSDPGVDEESLRNAAHELALNRREFLDSVLADLEKLSQRLFDLSQTEQVLLDADRAYRSYIEERILWIRSVSGAPLAWSRSMVAAGAWLTDIQAWKSCGRLLWSSARQHPFVAASSLLGILFALTVSRLARREILLIAEKTARYRTDSFWLTGRAFLLTVFAGAFWPITLMVVGWQLGQAGSQIELADALSRSLFENMPMVAVLFFVRASLRARGLFEAHFRWPHPVVLSIRHQLAWYIPVAITLSIVTGMFDTLANQEYIETFGRIAFVAHMMALSLLVQRVLRPRGPVMRTYLEKSRSRILSSGRHFWAVLSVGLPIALAILSLLGYHYTATRLYLQVQETIFLVVALIVVYAFMQRWLFLARRTVAIEAAQKKREAAQTRTDESSESLPIEDEGIDLPAISAQTQQIFSTVVFLSIVLGLFAIWSPVLPALRMLERVEVWPSVRVVSVSDDEGVPILAEGSDSSTVQTETNNPGIDQGATSTNETGKTAPDSPVNKVMPGRLAGPLDATATKNKSGQDTTVTLADLGAAAVIFFATMLAFRNLPGLIEIVVLQRLPLDAGSRYALSTILRYLIAIVGVSIGLSTVGLDWNKVQWLAAALTFGLAFGLQEIFANFVSGLIILAERPVRIGDTVTVDGITGNISRIRIRATTVLDWDRKELVIPNKSFVTGNVINWTLTDSILRIIIPVGVSYSSDVDLVERTLYKVANDDGFVLREPMPKVLFKNFGDSTLDFELRVYISAISNYFDAWHTLHMGITKAFREAGIEIAFPQRDLHLRSAESPVTIITRDGEKTINLSSPT